jgi:hypothetical protein
LKTAWLLRLQRLRHISYSTALGENHNWYFVCFNTDNAKAYIGIAEIVLEQNIKNSTG